MMKRKKAVKMYEQKWPEQAVTKLVLLGCVLWIVIMAVATTQCDSPNFLLTPDLGAVVDLDLSDMDAKQD
jgi:hypothetical protein